MDLQNLIQYVNKNPKLIRAKTKGELTILKYTKSCFFEDVWNEYTMSCRGLVYSSDGELVLYPFDKFFNYTEPQCPKIGDDEDVICSVKINGFLFNMANHKGKLICATSGSLDGEFYERALRYVDKENFLKAIPEGYTVMFECVAPDDYHVCEEAEGLYFLGMRKTEFGSPILQGNDILELLRPLGVRDVKFGSTNNIFPYGTIKKNLNMFKCEGFVVRTLDGRMTKLKTPHFLTKRFLAYCTEKKFDNLMNIQNLKKGIDYPEEFELALNHLKRHQADLFKANHAERVMWVKSMFSPVCYMMVGTPYSGKSTYIENRSYMSHYVCASMDDEVMSLAGGLEYHEAFPIVAKEASKNLKKKISTLIDNRNTFVWDGTNISKKARMERVQRLKSAGYLVFAVEMPIPSKEELQKRMENRTDKKVGLDIVEKMIKNYEPVGFDEGFTHILKVDYDH